MLYTAKNTWNFRNGWKTCTSAIHAHSEYFWEAIESNTKPVSNFFDDFFLFYSAFIGPFIRPSRQFYPKSSTSIYNVFPSHSWRCPLTRYSIDVFLVKIFYTYPSQPIIVFLFLQFLKIFFSLYIVSTFLRKHHFHSPYYHHNHSHFEF